MIAAGLGKILAPAQLTRTLVLNMTKYGAGEEPPFKWSAPADGSPDSLADRDKMFTEFYSYIRHCAADKWKLNHQPLMPSGIADRSADNVRSLLAVADACGKDWPQRARDAIVALSREATAENPEILILRHGLLLFEHLETEWLEIGHFNRELHKLSEPEIDWNQFRGASGRDSYARPISISEQGRLVGKAKVKAHSMWPPGVPRSQRKPGDCKRVLRRAEVEAALRRTESSPSTPSPTLSRP
jgi:hypothetical protein